MRLLLTALALSLTASPLSAQLGALTVTAGMPDTSEWGKSTRAPQLKSCGYPETRVGWWKTLGSVAFTIDSTGRVDTVTVMVVRSGPAAEESLESYARRLLVGCTWKPAQVNGAKTPVVVRITILPDQVSDIFLEGPPLAPPAVPDLYIVSARGLDELPRQKECEVHSREGRAAFSYIVGADGLVEAGSVVLIETNSKGTASAYLKSMPKCTFLPGRVKGVPVRTQLSADIDLVARDQVIINTYTRP